MKHARIAIKTRKRIVLINPAEVLTIEAEGNYVLVHKNAVCHTIRGKISDLADQLKPYGFIQIHRSVLVNNMHVKSIESLTTGEYRLQLPGGQLYTVTRTYKNNLQFLAGLWIGMDGFTERKYCRLTEDLRS
jgi:two-component system LytT family response regulator